MEEWTTQLLRAVAVGCKMFAKCVCLDYSDGHDRQDETETTLTQCPVLTVLGVDGAGVCVNLFLQLSTYETCYDCPSVHVLTSQFLIFTRNDTSETG